MDEICSLHFEPTDFYNFWGPCRRALREDAVTSKFPFPTKKTSEARRQLNRVQPSVELSSCEDDELNGIDEPNVNEEVEDVQEANAQLKAQLAEANEEIARLKQLLSDAKMEITKLPERSQ